MINAKVAYRGDIAQNYEAERVIENIWGIEQEFVKKYVEKLETGSNILDAPVGTGRFIKYYLEKELNITGMDISSDMLEETKKKVMDSVEKLNLVKGDIANTNFENDSFDYIICWRLAHLINFKKFKKIIRELHRINKKDTVIQIFNVEKYKPNLFIRCKRVAGQLLVINRQKKDGKSWEIIKNYVFFEEDIMRVFNKVGYKVKEIHNLGDEQYESKVYILSKHH